MPPWSYISYTSLNPSYAVKEPVAGFHPMFNIAAHKRIRQLLFKEFHGLKPECLHFLTHMVGGVLRNTNGKRAYLIVLESFGKPLFVIRNIAHTLQDPVDRGVYIVHLEEALHMWHEKDRQEDTCWESFVLVGIACIVAYGLRRLFLSHLSLMHQDSSWHAWTSYIRPHALMNYFS